jgi:hypothetical protein
MRRKGEEFMSNFAGCAMTLPLFLLITAVLRCSGTAQSAAPAKDLIGIWEATRNFGPVLRGPLTLTRCEGVWLAEIAGQRVRLNPSGNTINCVFPGGQGEFHGILNSKTDQIRGHWIQPPTANSMLRYASPVKLTSYDRNGWRGQVVPMEDEVTFYLVASAGENGTVHAFLRNPDRNLGVFLVAERLEGDGNVVKLIGHFRSDSVEQVVQRAPIVRQRSQSGSPVPLFSTRGVNLRFRARR